MVEDLGSIHDMKMEALEASLSISTSRLQRDSRQAIAQDDKVEMEVELISKLFTEHDNQILQDIMPMIKRFKILDQESFSGTGPAGLMLRRSLAQDVRGGILPVTKITDEIYAQESSGPLESLKRKIDQMEQLVQALDAKISNQTICFGGVQLR